MQLTQSEIDSLRAVSKAIEIDGGGSFDMDTWATQRDCGTACCIFGHMMLLEGRLPSYPESDGVVGPVRYSTYAFTDSEGIHIDADSWEEVHGEHWDMLFLRVNWPYHLQCLYDRDRVAAGQQAIEWFIAKYGPKQDTSEEVRDDVDTAIPTVTTRS